MTDRPSILVVDDELGPRESLRMILKPSYDVCTVENGTAALGFLEEHPVDLITLDLKMPGLSGMELLKQIRRSNPDVMVIVVTGYGSFKSVVEAIRLDVYDFISKPFNIPEIISVVERCLEMRNTKLAIRDLFQDISRLSEKEPPESQQGEVIKKIEKLLGDSWNLDPGRNGCSVLQFIRAISNWIEGRDPYVVGHSERVSHYTDSMAQNLGLSDSVRKELQTASYLHDIGKVSISSRFMNREGKLSSTDWAILKRHPVKSVELVGPLKLSSNVLLSIRHHHERYDGTGYPDGLAGSDIPFGAQLISIGNMYDVLTSKRPYRTAMSAEGAEAETRKSIDAYFDPDITVKFLEALREERDAFEHSPFQMDPDKEIS